MKPFAKLFHSDEIGQVLVTLHLTGEDTPELHITFDPDVDGLGMSSTKIGFPDTDAGEELAQRAFDLVTEESAVGTARIAIANIRKMFGEEVV